MASGSGKDPDDHIQELVHGQERRQESSASAAAAALTTEASNASAAGSGAEAPGAAAAEGSDDASSPPPPPAPPVERPRDGGNSPSIPSGLEAASSAAAEVDRKGKKVAIPSPAPSTLTFPSAVSGPLAISSSAAYRGRRANRRRPVLETVVEVKEKGEEEKEEEKQEEEQVKSPQRKKSLWSKLKNKLVDRNGMQICCFNQNATESLPPNSTSPEREPENRTGQRPHVAHETIPMSGAFLHYNLIMCLEQRVDDLNALYLPYTYSEFRPVLGDGECFYRSFIFSYLEQVLDRQDTAEEHRLLAALERVARLHQRLGWRSEFPRSHKAFTKLIKEVMSWKRQGEHNRELSTNSYPKQKLLEFFSGYGTMGDIFAFLRLVAAVWMCSHREEYEPLQTELREGYSLKDWCFDNIIPLGEFADHVPMTALATALGVPLRVENLNSGAPQDLYTAQASSSDALRRILGRRPAHEVPRVTVLYSGNHYDIIYPRPPPGEGSRRQAALGESSGEGSSQQAAQGESSGEGSSRQAAQGESSGEGSSRQAAQGGS